MTQAERTIVLLRLSMHKAVQDQAFVDTRGWPTTAEEIVGFTRDKDGLLPSERRRWV